MAGHDNHGLQVTPCPPTPPIAPNYGPLYLHCTCPQTPKTALFVLCVPVRNVNLAMTAAPVGWRHQYDLVSVDLDGSRRGRWMAPVERRRALVGAETIPVTLDEERSVRGQLFRFDHLPAAWLFVPRSTAGRAAFSVDGRDFVVRRPR